MSGKCPAKDLCTKATGITPGGIGRWITVGVVRASMVGRVHSRGQFHVPSPFRRFANAPRGTLPARASGSGLLTCGPDPVPDGSKRYEAWPGSSVAAGSSRQVGAGVSGRSMGVSGCARAWTSRSSQTFCVRVPIELTVCSHRLVPTWSRSGSSTLNVKCDCVPSTSQRVSVSATRAGGRRWDLSHDTGL